MTNFTEFEFRLTNGHWVRTCVDSKKVESIMDRLSSITEVRFPAQV